MNVLMLKNTTITDQNMRMIILESSVLTKPEELIMYETVLNIIHFFDVICSIPTCFSYKGLYKQCGVPCMMFGVTSKTDWVVTVFF
jgi:hypothetical protein